MDWSEAKDAPDGSVKIPDSWLHLFYYEALTILFRFENALRIFTYIVLKKQMHESWDTAAISDGSTIRTETRKRISQAREHGYLGYEVSSPMLFLNSGELTQIITSDAYWKHFAPYFKASKAIISTKLNEIGTVRNSLAHFRPIKQEDIDLIKQNSRHILLGVENCLQQITAISAVVPTNSTEPWYLRLMELHNECVQIALLQSEDRNWIRVQISYNVPILEKTTYNNHISFNVGNIRTGEIVKNYEQIRINCIYVTEEPAYGRLNDQYDIECLKKISVVFPRPTLAEAIDLLESEFQDIVEKIEKETDLVKNDRLALGQLIESKYASASYREKAPEPFWEVFASNLNTPLSQVDNVEFWGHRNNYSFEFITQTNHYPWMPSTISKESWPF